MLDGEGRTWFYDGHVPQENVRAAELVIGAFTSPQRQDSPSAGEAENAVTDAERTTGHGTRDPVMVGDGARRRTERDVSTLGDLIAAVGRIEAGQPGPDPVTLALEPFPGGVRVRTVQGGSVDLLVAQDSRAVRAALAAGVPGLRPTAPGVGASGFTPWSRRLGWAAYLVDLGTWEDLLRDFGQPLAYARIRWHEDTLHVTITDGARAQELTRPLDGTGFTGATPAELAADFLRPPG